MMIKPTTRTLSLLALLAFTTACSNQNLSSIPGSQLIGQRSSDTTKTQKVITKKNVAPQVTTNNSAPMRKTILRAPTTVAAPTSKTTNQQSSAFGVTASEPKMVASAKPTTTKKVVTPQAPKAATTQQNTTRRLTLNGSATFKTGSSSLSNDGQQKLTSLAKTLSGQGTNVTRLLIEGHTDSAGSAAANQVLSLRRANAVADYLAQEGLVRSSMVTVGLGESTPVADNKTKAGRALNRRVEITATGSRQTTR